jgi:hypothetical protein
MSKQSRRKKEYRQNASKGHQTIGELLRTSKYFANYKTYQEYPVQVVNSQFKSGREKFDWVILDLHIVIEFHGQQHREPVCFGGISKEEAAENFKHQKARDFAKRIAAEDAGFSYIVFWYDEDITEDLLLERIEEAQYQTCLASRTPPAEKKQKDPKHQEQLQKAKVYRKQQYKKQKERRKKHDSRRRSR